MKCLTVDNSGTIWIGFYGDGLFYSKDLKSGAQKSCYLLVIRNSFVFLYRRIISEHYLADKQILVDIIRC